MFWFLLLSLLLSYLVDPTQPLVLSCNAAARVFQNDLEFCDMVNWNSARVYNASSARQVYYEEVPYFPFGMSDNSLAFTSDSLAKGPNHLAFYYSNTQVE